MKKLLAILLALLMMMAVFAACGEDADKDNDSKDKTGSIVSDASSEQDDDTSSEDTSSTTQTGNATKINNITIVLPEGFSLIDADGGTMAVHESYPNIADNISFQTTIKASLSELSKDILLSTYESIFGKENITFIGYSIEKIDGVDVIVYAHIVTFEGVTMTQIQYMILGSTFTDTVTFTCLSDEYMELFEAASETIKLAK